MNTKANLKKLDEIIGREIFGYFQAEWQGEFGHWFSHWKNSNGVFQDIHAGLDFPIFLFSPSMWSNSLPKFSSDLTAAMGLIDKMFHIGYAIHVTSSIGIGYGMYIYGEDGGYNRHTKDINDLALCICNVALYGKRNLSPIRSQ